MVSCKDDNIGSAKTIENKIGARGLRGTMENIMTSAMFNMPSKDEKKLIVDIEYVKKYI